MVEIAEPGAATALQRLRVIADEVDGAGTSRDREVTKTQAHDQRIGAVKTKT